MPNELFNVSADTRTKSLVMPGFVFLNDVVLVAQVLSTPDVGVQFTRHSTGDLLPKWKTALTQLMAAVIYGDDTKFGANDTRWSLNRTKVKAIANSGTAMVPEMASALEKWAQVYAADPLKPTHVPYFKALFPLIEAFSKLTMPMDEYLPKGIPVSGWTTFARNIPREFAAKRFTSKLKWEKAPLPCPSKEGTQALSELYTRLFMDEVNSASNDAFDTSSSGVANSGVFNPDFISLNMRPTNNALVSQVASRLASERLTDEDALQFLNVSKTRSFLVFSGDIEKARKHLTEHWLNKAEALAKDLLKRLTKAEEAEVSEKVRKITVTAVKAKRLVQVLTPQELNTLIALIAKADAKPVKRN